MNPGLYSNPVLFLQSSKYPTGFRTLEPLLILLRASVVGDFTSYTEMKVPSIWSTSGSEVGDMSPSDNEAATYDAPPTIRRENLISTKECVYLYRISARRC